MPDAQGNPVPGDPGYVAPTGQTSDAGGIMNTTQPPAATPTAAPVAPYTPINQPADTVPKADTVSSRVSNIISNGSPLLDQAIARANQKANERGLLNSSEGVRTAESALYDAALPIASADATQAMQKYTADLSSNTQLQAQSVDNAFKTAFQTADTAAKLQLQQAHDKVLKDIADVEANYKTLMQTSASASDVYKSTMANIANIYADTSIDAGSKARVINGYLGWMQQSMNMIGSVNGVDLTGLNQFGPVSA